MDDKETLGTREAFQKILRTAVEEGASDVHLKPGSPPKMRKDGQLVPVPGYALRVLSGEETSKIRFFSMNAQNLGEFEQVKHGLNYSFTLDNPRVRFRVNVFRTMNEYALVARVISERPKTLGELGIPVEVHALSAHRSGLVLVTGATGSGKSNTLAGMIHLINTSRNVHIISIEDPVEILHSDARASVSQREIGPDVPDAKIALKEAMREDPDVIFIGEIRDAEMLAIALEAADTGHLVISTLHTTDAPSSIQRIMSLVRNTGTEEKTREVLAASLRGIVSQRLEQRADGPGRVAVCEVMLSTREVQHAILNKAPSHHLHELIAAGAHGMQTFEQHYAKLVERGTITYEVAREGAIYQDELVALLPEHAARGGNSKGVKTLHTPLLSTPRLPGLGRGQGR